MTLDKKYDQWSVTITNHLDYNASSHTSLKVDLEDADSTDYLEVCFDDVNDMFSVWMIGGDTYKLGNLSGGWEDSKPVVVSYAGGYVEAVASNGTVVFSDYAVGTFTIDKVAAWNHNGTENMGKYGFTGGYVTVEVDWNIVGGLLASLTEYIIPVVMISAVVVAMGGVGTVASRRRRRRRRR